MMATPSLPLPPGSCDCHMHIYDARFPARPNALFRAAGVPAYRTLAATLGIDRMVVVQPSGYGFDNACTLDTMAQLGAAARGIVVIEPGTPRAELERLNALGVRGVRFMMALPGGLDWTVMDRMAADIAPLGWHVNLQFDGHQLATRTAQIQALPVDVVIDHYAAFHDGFDLNGPSVAALRRLLDTGRVWIKLASPYAYRMSRSGPPRFEDIGRLTRLLATNHPERCLWASNWPHVTETPPLPVDSELLALMREWVGSEATLARIAVDNPARLYGFDAAPTRPSYQSPQLRS